MIKRLPLALALLLTSAAGHAAEPLFLENGATRSLVGPAAAANSPFGKDNKVRSARLGLHVNPAALGAAELSLSLPDGRRFNARRAQRYDTRAGVAVWVGKHNAAAPGTAEAAAEETILVVHEGRVTGSIRHGGKLYRIRSAADGSHAVAEIDSAAFPRDHDEDEYRRQLERPVPAYTPSGTTLMPAADGTPVIRLLVNYTPAAKNRIGDIVGEINLAVAETNQGYVNAGVNARVELAHVAPVSYSESGSNSTDRSRYADVDDRVMDEIHAQRNTYAADVGVLMTEGNSGCGNGTIHASNTSAFVAVTADCAVGNYSFGHELGHLFGARHNPEEDSTTTPYAYGHGYLSPNRNWRTIMAYDCPNGCPRINWWSNPAKTRDGVAMGTSTRSNNARVLNERAATLAGFRAAPVSTGVTVSNTGDYTIPDNNTTGVSSPVTVGTAGSAGAVTVDVRVIHPYIGDLVMDLIAPDGTAYNLHNRTGSGTDNIIRSYSLALGSKARLGTWRLRVSDRAAQDTGHIESWTFKSQ